ncbi:MAG: DOPA 4,5-dioxygenase family protein [Burkholderiaceae bacterium]
MIARPSNIHAAYHAHVYFGPDTVEQARALHEAAARDSGASIGRFHEKNVGPHPHWSFQMAFTRERFNEVIGWLEANRGGLDVLVHGLTGNDLEDHTTHATWLGDPAVLNLGMFRTNQ